MTEEKKNIYTRYILNYNIKKYYPIIYIMFLLYYKKIVESVSGKFGDIKKKASDWYGR